MGIFSEIHPKLPQRDVSLRKLCRPVGIVGFVESPVVSNVGWEADRHLWKYSGK